RVRSSVVRPGRPPRSRSACRTQWRSVSAAHPIFSAIDVIAAHCQGWSWACSNTIRTARSRTSGENRLGLAMPPILPSTRASGKPGAVPSSMLPLPFIWYGGLFLRVSHGVSRQQELAADRLAARIAGGAALAAGLRKIAGTATAFGAYWTTEVEPVVRAGYA